MEETEYVPAWMLEAREASTHLIFQMLILHLERNVSGFSASTLKRETLEVVRAIAARQEDNAVTQQMRAWSEEIIDAMLLPDP